MEERVLGRIAVRTVGSAEIVPRKGCSTLDQQVGVFPGLYGAEALFDALAVAGLQAVCVAVVGGGGHGVIIMFMDSRSLQDNGWRAVDVVRFCRLSVVSTVKREVVTVFRPFRLDLDTPDSRTSFPFSVFKCTANMHLTGNAFY